MNLQNLRWPMLVTTLGVTLLLLFGAGYLFKVQAVDGPLKAALTGDPTVLSYRLERATFGREVVVFLADTPNLEKSYTAIHAGVDRSLRGTAFKLRVEDRRTPELEEVHRKLNLHLHEAVVTGRFSEMAARIEAEAERSGVVAHMDVDAERVYLQMHKGGAYLYSVMDRESNEVGRPVKGGLGL